MSSPPLPPSSGHCSGALSAAVGLRLRRRAPSRQRRRRRRRRCPVMLRVAEVRARDARALGRGRAPSGGAHANPAQRKSNRSISATRRQSNATRCDSTRRGPSAQAATDNNVNRLFWDRPNDQWPRVGFRAAAATATATQYDQYDSLGRAPLSAARRAQGASFKSRALRLPITTIIAPIIMCAD